MVSVLFNYWKYSQLGDTGITPINFKTDTIKASLHTSSYTPNADSHDFWDDTTNEVSSSGSYTAGIGGGITLTITVSQDNTDDEGVVDAVDSSVTSFSGTFRFIVLRKDTGVATTSRLVCAIDLGSDVSATLGTVSIVWAAEGILNLG